MDDLIDPLYYYMQFIKFGFGRSLRDASRLVQNKHMNRDEALKMVSKYDGEFPNDSINEVLDYLDCNLNEFNENIDRHRNKEIWKVDGNKYKRTFEVK